MNDKSWKSKIPPVLAGLAVLAAGAWGFARYRQWESTVSTDNAQIDGDVVPVVARGGGTVREIRFRDDQPVREGDTLVVFENREAVLHLEEALAALAAQRTGVAVARTAAVATRSGATPAQAGIDGSSVRLEKARRELDRQKQLSERQATTREKLETAQAEFEAATADVAGAKSRLESALRQSDLARTQISASEAAIRQKEAEVELARVQLSYAAVVAPSAGIVSKRSVHLGQVVPAGAQLCAVVQRDSLRVAANFKETQMERLRPGASADIEVDAFPGVVAHGRVSSISGASGAKFSLLPPDNASGNFVKVVQRIPVRIALDPDPSLAALLRPGMSVSVSVHVD